MDQSSYSAIKIAAVKMAESFWLSFETLVTIVRPFNTHGLQQGMRAVLFHHYCPGSDKGELIQGSLCPVLGLTFIKDTVRNFLAIVKFKKVIGKIINLGVGYG